MKAIPEEEKGHARMYQRDIKDKVSRLVVGGSPNAGSYFDPIDALNLKDLFRRQSPLPALNGLRIKEWVELYLSFPGGRARMLFGTMRVFCVAECSLALDGLRPLENRAFLPFDRFAMHRSLKRARVDYKAKGLSLRFKSDLHDESASLDISIPGGKRGQAFQASVSLAIPERAPPPLVTVAPLGPGRAAYAHQAFCRPRGSLSCGGESLELPERGGLALLRDYKAVHWLSSDETRVSALGFLPNGKAFGLSLCSSPNQGRERNSECCFWLDSKAYPLPPVKITMTDDKKPRWIIQDTEGIVDLEFKPEAKGARRGGILERYLSRPGAYGTLHGALAIPGLEAARLESFPAFGEAPFIVL
jgi:hypothetical protein